MDVKQSVGAAGPCSAPDFSSIDGRVTVGAGRFAGRLNFIDAQVTLKPGAHAESIRTVDGMVILARGASVQGSILMVDGLLQLAPETVVGGDIKAAYGRLDIRDATVTGDIETTAGRITLAGCTRIRGCVRVCLPRSASGEHPVCELAIGAGVVIDGGIVAKAPVHIVACRGAAIGTVSGAAILWR